MRPGGSEGGVRRNEVEKGKREERGETRGEVKRKRKKERRNGGGGDRRKGETKGDGCIEMDRKKMKENVKMGEGESHDRNRNAFRIMSVYILTLLMMAVILSDLESLQIRFT